MNIKTQLTNDVIAALRAKDDLRKRTLRMALSAIKLAEIEKRGALDESTLLSILQKEVKSRREAISDAERANRPDLVAASQDEIAVLETYLPQPFSLEELEELAQQAIDEVSAASPRALGQVMKKLIPRLLGRATGKEASQAVIKLLQ